MSRFFAVGCRQKITTVKSFITLTPVRCRNWKWTAAARRVSRPARIRESAATARDSKLQRRNSISGSKWRRRSPSSRSPGLIRRPAQNRNKKTFKGSTKIYNKLLSLSMVKWGILHQSINDVKVLIKSWTNLT
jgi:hypothetical protein